MPTPTFQPPQGQMDTAQLQDWIVKLIRDLNFMLGNLDTLNVNRLDAKVIIAQTITANKMNVAQLSAIAADLGKVIAGILIGAYISTADGTYPRIDFSSAGNLLQAFTDANNYISIVPNSGGQPLLEFKTGTTAKAVFFSVPGTFAMNTQVGNLSIQAQAGNLSLSASSALKLSGASLTMDGFTGYNNSFPYVKDVVAGVPTYGTITVTKGIITSVV